MVGLQESRDIHVSVDEGIPQLLGQVYVDIYIFRWSDDEMYPNDGIPQAMIMEDVFF